MTRHPTEAPPLQRRFLISRAFRVYDLVQFSDGRAPRPPCEITPRTWRRACGPSSAGPSSDTGPTTSSSVPDRPGACSRTVSFMPGTRWYCSKRVAARHSHVARMASFHDCRQRLRCQCTMTLTTGRTPPSRIRRWRAVSSRAHAARASAARQPSMGWYTCVGTRATLTRGMRCLLATTTTLLTRRRTRVPKAREAVLGTRHTYCPTFGAWSTFAPPAQRRTPQTRLSQAGAAPTGLCT